MRLAGATLSDPEVGRRVFISQHTVERHLKKVFPKFGIISSEELVGALQASGARSSRAALLDSSAKAEPWLSCDALRRDWGVLPKRRSRSKRIIAL